MKSTIHVPRILIDYASGYDIYVLHPFQMFKALLIDDSW